MAAYSRLNNVNLTPSAIAQIRLPFRKGGHGFNPIAPLLHASYSASLMDSAPMRVPHPQHLSIDRYIQKARSFLKIFVRNLSAQIQPLGFALRQNLPDGLGHLETQALATRPERTHQTLFQAYRESVAQTFWHDSVWRAILQPSDHTTATVRRGGRSHSLVGTNAAAFLIAHPSTSTTVHSTHWSVMLRRQLDLPVYENSTPTLTCPHCHRRMNCRGDHATKCSHGFGFTHRHNTLRNSVAKGDQTGRSGIQHRKSISDPRYQLTSCGHTCPNKRIPCHGTTYSSHCL